MGLKFFKEPNGDYLCIETSTWGMNCKDTYEGRSACAQGDVKSVTTSAIHEDCLKECQELKLGQVPRDWRDAFGVY